MGKWTSKGVNIIRTELFCLFKPILKARNCPIIQWLSDYFS